MELDSTEKDATKASRSSRASRKAKKKSPQPKKDPERDTDLSRTAQKRRRGEKGPELHTPSGPREIGDDRELAPRKTGTYEVLNEGSAVTPQRVHGAVVKDEQARLSELPTAEQRFVNEGRTEPPGLMETECIQMSSSESQSKLKTASPDFTTAPGGVSGEAAQEKVQSPDTEPEYTTRTIGKTRRSQVGDEVERAVEKSCPAEEPKAKSLSAPTQPDAEVPEEGKKPSKSVIMSPEANKGNSNMIYCAGTSFVLLAFIVVMLSAFRPRYEQRHYDTCYTLACNAYSKRLRESINSSANPCDSFTHYVCDGWNSRYEISVNDDALLFSLARMSQVVRDMKVPKSGQNVIQRAAAFYRSCDCVRRGECNHLTDVLLALKSANIVWPLKAERPDFLQTLLHVSIKLRWPSILTFNAFAIPPKLYLTQGPSNEFFFLGLKANEQNLSPGTRQRYFEVLKKHFMAARSAEIHDDLVTFQEIREAEQNIWDVLWRQRAVHRLSSIDEYFHYLSRNFTVEWWKGVIADYGVGTHNYQDIVMLTDSFLYSVAFFEMWEKYGDEDMHLLLSWCTVQVAAWFANQELLFNFYGTNQKVELGHAAFCFSKTFVATGDALIYRKGQAQYLQHLFCGHLNRAVNQAMKMRVKLERVARLPQWRAPAFSEATLPGSLRPAARAIILDVRESMRRRLLSWKHHDDNVTVVHYWNSTAVVLQYFEKPIGEHYDAESESKDIIEKGTVNMGESLVANWLLAANTSFLNPTSRRLSKVIQEMGLYLLDTNTFKPDMSMLPYAFSFPYFDHEAARALNYAGIGSRVAEALSLLLDSAYFLSKEASEEFIYHIQCMENATTSEIDPSRRAKYFEPLSLKTALYAYRARETLNEQRLRGLEFLTSEQLFFVAACYVRCARTTGPPGVADELCDASFRHVAEFSDAFRCKRGSRMNPLHRCELF